MTPKSQAKVKKKTIPAIPIFNYFVTLKNYQTNIHFENI